MSAAWLDRVNSWVYNAKRQRIPKATAWLRATIPGAYLPGGWGLITWSAWGWNRRAWAASIGVLLLLNVSMRLLAVYIESKRRALSRPND